MKKKMITLLLAITTFMSLTTSAYAVSGDATLTPAFFVLIEHGFPEDFLARRTDAEITELYQLCQDEDIVFGGSEIAYYSEDGEIQPYGAIPEADMALESYAVYKLNSNGSIKSCEFHVDYCWALGHPSIRKDDAIAVNWDPDVWAYGDSFKHVDYEVFEGINVPVTTKTSPTKSVQGGLGYYADIQPVAEYVAGGTTTFTLVPKDSPMYRYGSQSSFFTSQINVNYAHDKSILPGGGVSFTYNGTGIGIDLGLSSDEASTTFTDRYSYSK